MDNNYLIRNAYSNHDNFLEKYSKLLSLIYSSESTWDQEKNESDIEPSIIHWKDKNGKTITKAKYEILGIEISNNNKKLWIWSWAHPLLDKNKTYLSRKILNYGLDISNLDESIKNFARACMNYGLNRNWPVYLSTKNTILKVPVPFKR